MRQRDLIRRTAILLLLLGADRALAQLASSAVVSPTDPVVSARCKASPTAFGCANAANLAAMARPADLAAGGSLAPADGALEAAAVGRLLRDEVKDLRREGTGTSAGNGAPQ